MNEMTYEERENDYQKRKQEILSRIFITHEEALKLREKKIEEREKDYKGFVNQNKNFQNIFGNILREFELKENINDGTDSKQLLDRLWNYILSVVPKMYELPMKQRRKRLKIIDMKLQKHLDILKQLRRKRAEEMKHGKKE